MLKEVSTRQLEQLFEEVFKQESLWLTVAAFIPSYRRRLEKIKKLSGVDTEGLKDVLTMARWLKGCRTDSANYAVDAGVTFSNYLQTNLFKYAQRGEREKAVVETYLAAAKSAVALQPKPSHGY